MTEEHNTHDDEGERGQHMLLRKHSDGNKRTYAANPFLQRGAIGGSRPAVCAYSHDSTHPLARSHPLEGQLLQTPALSSSSDPRPGANEMPPLTRLLVELQ